MYQTLDQSIEGTIFAKRSNLIVDTVLLTPAKTTYKRRQRVPKAMLLSSERPFVGAFAVHIPRATLLYRNGLVQAVLPASTEHVQTDN